MLKLFVEQPRCGWSKSRLGGSLNTQLCGWMKYLLFNYWKANLKLNEEPMLWLIEQPIEWLTKIFNMLIEQPSGGWRKSILCGSLNSQLRGWLKCLISFLNSQFVAAGRADCMAPWTANVLAERNAQSVIIEQSIWGWMRSQLCSFLNSQLCGLTGKPSLFKEQEILWLKDELDMFRVET